MRTLNHARTLGMLFVILAGFATPASLPLFSLEGAHATHPTPTPTPTPPPPTPTPTPKVIYVNTAIGSSGNGLTWGNAKKTIGEAISITWTNDQIWVAQGTYQELVTMAANVSIYGGFAGAETLLTQRNWTGNITTIDGNSGGSTVTGANGALLDGFTVTGGSATEGGGILCQGTTPEIRNCTVTGNTASQKGGGVYTNSSTTLTNCVISENSAPSGAGVYSNIASPSLSKCIIRENTGVGMYFYKGTGSLINCVIVGNTANPLYIDHHNAEPTFTNCTITGHTVTAPVIPCDGNPTFTNCILWNGGDEVDESGNPTLNYCCVQGGWSGSGGNNLSGDPKFFHPWDGSTHDLHLRYGSPCIDSGDNSSAPGTDLEGNSRPANSTVDMGAYECTPSLIYVDEDATSEDPDGTSWTDAFPLLTEGLSASVPGDEIWVAEGTYSGPIALTRAVNLYGGFDPDNDIETMEERNPETYETIISGGGSGAVVTAQSDLTLDGFTITGGDSSHSDGGGGLYAASLSNLTITRCVVKDNSADTNGGGLLFKECSSIVVSNSQILNNVATENDGGGIMSFETNMTVTGCTIRGNSAPTLMGGGIAHEQSDAGNYKLTLSSSKILDNQSNSGGAGLVFGRGTSATADNWVDVDACEFRGNRTTGTNTFGGAVCAKFFSHIYTSSFVNCLFIGNQADFGGSALWLGMADNLEITHCTFTGNSTITSSEDPGIIYVDTADITIQNSICWNDGSALEIKEVNGTTATITDSCIQGQADAPNNVIDDDPRFLARWNGYSVDAHLQPTSPCINEGAAVSVNVDFEGNGRPYQTNRDMGAYEWQGQKIIYVDIEAEGSDDGTSWTDAYTVLNDALDNAISGDEVWVSKGTYFERISLVTGVGIFGGFGGSGNDRGERNWSANATIIDATYLLGHVVIGADNAILDGFTITNGRAIVFASQKSDYSQVEPMVQGGGIYCNGSSPHITNCWITNNIAAGSGGGVFCTNFSNPTFTYCVMAGNRSLSGSGGACSTRGSSPHFCNVTITGNEAGVGGDGIELVGDSKATMSNSILWGNGDEISVDGSSAFTVDYSCIQGGYAGTGNVSGAPRFYAAWDGTSADLRLLPGSPCIEGGEPIVAPKDLHAKSVPIGSGVDMGALEAFDGKIVYVDLNATGSNNGESWSDAYTTISAALADQDLSPGDLIFVGTGHYTNSSISISDEVAIIGGFVNRTETETDQASSDYDLTIITASPNSRTIEIANVEEDDVYWCVLKNFTITGGNSTSNGGGIYATNANFRIENCHVVENVSDDNGGGIYFLNCDTELVDCIIEDNTAGDDGSGNGGGIYCDGNPPLVRNCQIIDNQAIFGGGIYINNSTARFEDCVINSNVSTNSGGGVYLYGDLIFADKSLFSNCEIADNHSTGGSGGGVFFYIGGVATFDNGCVFAANSAQTSGGGVAAETGSHVTFTDCTFTGNTATTGDGGALWLKAIVQSSTINRCTIDRNSASGVGGGISLHNAFGTIANCIVNNNESTGSSGGGLSSSGSSTSVFNTLFAYNTAWTYGGGTYCTGSSSLDLVNCTISQNTAGSGGEGFYCTSGDSSTINNCILWWNGTDDIGSGGCTPTVTYSNIGETISGTGNINQNPLFVLTGSDFRLKPESPCIDAADPNELVEKDLAGIFRTTLGSNGHDMGAYEFDGVVLGGYSWATSEQFGNAYVLMQNKHVDSVPQTDRLSWLSRDSDPDLRITFDLGAIYDLEEIRLWNYSGVDIDGVPFPIRIGEPTDPENPANPTAAEKDQRNFGIQSADIWISEDGIYYEEYETRTYQKDPSAPDPEPQRSAVEFRARFVQFRDMYTFSTTDYNQTGIRTIPRITVESTTYNKAPLGIDEVQFVGKPVLEAELIQGVRRTDLTDVLVDDVLFIANNTGELEDPSSGDMILSSNDQYTFELPGLYFVEKIIFFNYLDTEGSDSDLGVKDLNIKYSRDNSVFKCFDDGAACNSGNGKTYTLTQSDDGTGQYKDEIDLGITAQYIKIENLTNHRGSGDIGLSEVMIVGHEVVPSVVAKANSSRSGTTYEDDNLVKAIQPVEFLTMVPDDFMWHNDENSVTVSGDGVIVAFDLGGEYRLSFMDVWNYTTDAAIRTLKISYSPWTSEIEADFDNGDLGDALAAATELGDFEFLPGARSPSTENYSEKVPLGNIRTRYIFFHDMTNYDLASALDPDARGLSEVQFAGSFSYTAKFFNGSSGVIPGAAGSGSWPHDIGDPVADYFCDHFERDAWPIAFETGQFWATQPELCYRCGYRSLEWLTWEVPLGECSEDPPCAVLDRLDPDPSCASIVTCANAACGDDLDDVEWVASPDPDPDPNHPTFHPLGEGQILHNLRIPFEFASVGEDRFFFVDDEYEDIDGIGGDLTGESMLVMKMQDAEDCAPQAANWNSTLVGVPPMGVFKLNSGFYQDPTKIRYGWHIYRVKMSNIVGANSHVWEYSGNYADINFEFIPGVDASSLTVLGCNAKGGIDHSGEIYQQRVDVVSGNHEEDDLSQDFHVFRILYTPQTIQLFVDDKKNLDWFSHTRMEIAYQPYISHNAHFLFTGGSVGFTNEMTISGGVAAQPVFAVDYYTYIPLGVDVKMFFDEPE